MLRAIKRLLLQHDYEPILFSSAQAFKNHSDIEKAACVILDIDLPDGSGIELREGPKGRRRLRAGYLHHREREPESPRGCRGLWMRGVSHQAILSARTDRAAQEGIGRAFIGSVAVRSLPSPLPASSRPTATTAASITARTGDRQRTAPRHRATHRPSTTGHHFGWHHTNRPGH